MEEQEYNYKGNVLIAIDEKTPCSCIGCFLFNENEISCKVEEVDEDSDVIYKACNKLGTKIFVKKDSGQKVSENKSPLDVQVGGNHYKDSGIQPIEFSEKNKLTFSEGNVVKYVFRHRNKNGLQDLEKVGHYLDFVHNFSKDYEGRDVHFNISLYEFVRANNLGYFEGKILEELVNFITFADSKYIEYAKIALEQLKKTYE